MSEQLWKQGGTVVYAGTSAPVGCVKRLMKQKSEIINRIFPPFFQVVALNSLSGNLKKIWRKRYCYFLIFFFIKETETMNKDSLMCLWTVCLEDICELSYDDGTCSRFHQTNILKGEPRMEWNCQNSKRKCKDVFQEILLGILAKLVVKS